MTIFDRRRLLMLAAASPAVLVLAGLLAGSMPRQAVAQAPADELAAHRAVYELKLANTRGKSTVAVRGRILYDFSGNVCDGYALQFRQVSELDNGEGKVTLSDLRTTTWEDGNAKKLIFKSQNYVNQQPDTTVDGQAERTEDKIKVTLTQPQGKTFDLASATAFPTEHMRRIIAAARAGKSILELPVYDGSDTGEKLYNTLTVIGQEIPSNQRVPTDAAAGNQVLANLKRWPVTVTYFDKTDKNAGDQSPAYSIKFELYENGVSRALVLDYNDFAISGELTSLDLKEVKACR